MRFLLWDVEKRFSPKSSKEVVARYTITQEKLLDKAVHAFQWLYQNSVLYPRVGDLSIWYLDYSRLGSEEAEAKALRMEEKIRALAKWVHAGIRPATSIEEQRSQIQAADHWLSKQDISSVMDFLYDYSPEMAYLMESLGKTDTNQAINDLYGHSPVAQIWVDDVWHMEDRV